MKLKCRDGKVRHFIVSMLVEGYEPFTEARCLECGKNFGVHSLRVLKPMFKNHSCMLDENDNEI